jgi:hypothetical protein
MMNDKIELKATKLPDEISAICCVACGHVSERPLMAAKGEAEGKGIIICPHCLAEGDIDAKLERHAACLESRSRWLRALIGRLEVPSPAVLVTGWPGDDGLWFFRPITTDEHTGAARKWAALPQ